MVGESCSEDADCYESSLNWCHVDTGLCTSKSDWGERCVSDEHCKHDKACLGGYCCDYIRSAASDSFYGGTSYCTSCVPKTDAAYWFRDHEGECTACEAGSWLDVSRTQNEIDREAEWDTRWRGVVADFGTCRKNCTSSEFQDGIECTAKKDAGQVCGEFSHNFRPGTSSDQCTSGLCGGSYCCDEAAANTGYMTCDQLCISGCSCCSHCSQYSGECVRMDSCPADAGIPYVAPTNGGVGNCTDSLASGSTCQPTCDSGYTVSGTSSCDAGTLTAAMCSANLCSASTDSSKDGSDGTFYCINGGTVGGTTGSCTCTSCDAGYEGLSCEAEISSALRATVNALVLCATAAAF